MADQRRLLKDILSAAEERGWKVEQKTKAICLKHPNGGMYHVHRTVSDSRALTTIKRALERIEEGRPAGAH